MTTVSDHHNMRILIGHAGKVLSHLPVALDTIRMVAGRDLALVDVVDIWQCGCLTPDTLPEPLPEHARQAAFEWRRRHR